MEQTRRSGCNPLEVGSSDDRNPAGAESKCLCKTYLLTQALSTRQSMSNSSASHCIFGSLPKGPCRNSTCALVMRLVITGCLLICLQLQAYMLSGALLLGSGHTHQDTTAPPIATDPMEGWKDFRQVSHDDSTSASRHAGEAVHASMHREGGRHHHDAADQGVIKDEASLAEETAASEFAQSDAGAVYIKAALAPEVAPAVEIYRRMWVTLSRPSVPCPCPWRIERPPQVSRAPGAVPT